MSFLAEVIRAANDGIYEFKDFLRTRCRSADADITIEFGQGVAEVVVQFVEGIGGESDETLWLILANATASTTEINCDRGDVTILVEFDL